MPLCKNPVYIPEPTPLQCGQAVLAMLTGKTAEEIAVLTGTERETTLKDMLSLLEREGIGYSAERRQASAKCDLPEICILSLETPKCWHWSLFYKGRFLDPEHGVLDDVPVCGRKYFWEIKE